MLLTRDKFRHGVFERDAHTCVMCDLPAEDAHHIIERRLFDDSGYYIDNGVSLCEEHHIKAEQTVISCTDLREAAGIKKIILPPRLYQDTRYDKWGNVILPDGRRLKGELFFDSSGQKILKLGGVLDQFCTYVKYPRTWHLPWSYKVHRNDMQLSSTEHFNGKKVVVTIKMDGENTTMYNDYLHARSVDSANHPSRSWAKSIHAKIGWNIPEGWRVCTENMFAKHTVIYENLESYVLAFSIWNEKNECLSWDDTLEWAALLGFAVVPVLYVGIWDEKAIQALCPDTHAGDKCEGYVVRLFESFTYGDFRKSVAKYVKPEFADELRVGSSHWKYKAIVPNKLRGSNAQI